MEELIMVASTEHLLVPLSHVKGKDATRCAEPGMAHHMLGDVLCIGLKSVPCEQLQEYRSADKITGAALSRIARVLGCLRVVG